MRHLAAAIALIALSACAAPQMQPRATIRENRKCAT
jgi:hypothetical protein